jgi:hypothetical protein
LGSLFGLAEKKEGETKAATIAALQMKMSLPTAGGAAKLDSRAALP